MSTYLDKGIVLGSYNLSESDKIIILYTRENGLVKAISKGIRKPKSKFKGKLDKLSCCNFQFARGKNLDIISDLEQVNSFHRLRKNLTSLSFGILFLEIVKSFAHEEESESEFIFDLLYSSLEKLEENIDIEYLSISFITEFLYIHGFKPQFENCVHCNKSIDFIENKKYPFSSELGGLLCNSCLNVNHILIDFEVIKIFKVAELDITDYGVWIEDIGEKIKNSKIELVNLNQAYIRKALNILKDYLNSRAKNKINSFDLIFSL